MTDLRLELQRPRDALGNPLTFKHRAGVVVLVLLAVGLLAVADVPRPAALLVAAFVAAMVAVLTAMTRRPPPRFRATPTTSGIEIATSVWRAIGTVLLAWTTAAALGLWAAGVAPSPGAVVLGAGAAWCAWTGLLMCIAPDTRGTVLLTRDGIAYANQRFRTTLAWDDVDVAAADEERMSLRIAVPPGQVVALRRPPGRIRRPRPTVPDVLTVTMHMMGVLPTDLLRVVAHYAQTPGARSELATEPSLLRIQALCGAPVTTPYTEQELRRTTPEPPAGAPVELPAPSFAVAVLDPYSAALSSGGAPSSARRRPLLAAAVRENRVAARGLHWLWTIFGVLSLGIGLVALAVDNDNPRVVVRGALAVITGILLLVAAVVGAVSTRRRARELLEVAEGRRDT